MKNKIIVLLRSELNYLIKYDSLRSSSDRIIHLSYSEFGKLSKDIQINILQNSMPIYEQDHEVLLIEYNRDLEFDNAPLLRFKGISSIIPLTETALKLLSSKLNIDFNILKPLESSVYKSFSNFRSHILRYEAGKQLCSIYKLETPKEDFITDFKAATLFQLNNSKPKVNDTTLAHLVDFNTTPSFIPEGNIEALIKSACIGMRKLGQDVDKITKSAFYNFVIHRKSEINEKSLFKAVQYINKNTIDEDELKRFNKLKDTLSENDKYPSAFLLFTYFYYLKRLMEKNHYDIEIIKENILELKYYDSESASKALFMLGYTFSIQTISKSLQSFSSTPLIKTKNSLDLDWKPEIVEEITAIQPENISSDKEVNEIGMSDSLNDRENYQTENKIPTVIPLSVNEEEEPFVKSKSKLLAEDERSPEVKLSIQNTSDVIDGSLDSGMNIHNKVLNKTGDLFASEIVDVSPDNKSFQQQELCNLDNFKKSIGTGKFAESVIEVLRLQIDANEEFSKQTLINCLKEIDQYQTKSGKISFNAKKALKIFGDDE